jgi:O-methyltransferase
MPKERLEMRSFVSRVLRRFSRQPAGKREAAAGKADTAAKRLAKLRAEKEALKLQLKGYKDKLRVPAERLEYNSDGLSVWGKNLEFMSGSRFESAYAKGTESGHRFAEVGAEFHIEWRVHVILWAAGLGIKLEGDFVECGVNTGIYSLAIADYFDFSSSGRKFYLFDTFCGTPEDQMNDEELKKRPSDNALRYPDCFELAKKNFEPYPNMHLVRGRVPDTLSDAGVGNVAYLSIDMNVAQAELEAIKYFWPKLVPGAPVVLDDYGWADHRSQKVVMDQFAQEVGVQILTLPTGQGLIIKGV